MQHMIKFIVTVITKFLKVPEW